MDQAFSQEVTSPGWLDEAHAWVHARAEEAGHALAGPIEQRRVRPWSTQLVVPTDRGRLWFKANCTSMAFEPALHDLLARVAPDQPPDGSRTTNTPSESSPRLYFGARTSSADSNRSPVLMNSMVPTSRDEARRQRYRQANRR